MARAIVAGEDVPEPVVKELTHASFIAHVDAVSRASVPQFDIVAPVRRLHVFLLVSVLEAALHGLGGV